MSDNSDNNLVALHGDRLADAHQFIDEAIAAGATRLVVMTLPDDDEQMSLRTFGTRSHRARDLALMGQMLIFIATSNMSISPIIGKSVG